MGWFPDLIRELPPVLLGVALCLGVFTLLVQKGLVRVGKQNRAISESGRHRAVQTLDLIEEHQLDMPGHWQRYVARRADAGAERGTARVAALEAQVSELKLSNQKTNDSVVRLETKLEGMKEDIAEVKGGLLTLNQTIAENGRRTHQLLGTLLERGKV